MIDYITHAEGCWNWGQKHYTCALAENARLRMLLREVSEIWVNGRRVLDGIPLTLANKVRGELDSAETVLPESP